jgi:hypothetical protein
MKVLKKNMHRSPLFQENNLGQQLFSKHGSHVKKGSIFDVSN